MSEAEPDLLDGASCGAHAGAAAAFVCTRCGTYGCAECAFSALPKREVCRACADKGLGEPVPWERRKELGTWRAYWSTVRLVLRSPAKFYRTPTTQPSVVGAVVHGVASTTIGLLLSYVVAGVLVALGGGTAGLIVGGEDGATIAGIAGVYGCFMIGMSPLALLFGPANALFGLAVAAACAHGVLALFKKTRASFEDTLRVICYANAPFAWSWIPFAGGFAYVWMIGIEVVGLRETHRCGTDWAVAAAVGYRLALLLVLVGTYAALFGLLVVLERRVA